MMEIMEDVISVIMFIQVPMFGVILAIIAYQLENVSYLMSFCMWAIRSIRFDLLENLAKTPKCPQLSFQSQFRHIWSDDCF